MTIVNGVRMPKRHVCGHVDLNEAQLEELLQHASFAAEVNVYNTVIAMVSARASTAFLANQDDLARAYKALRDDLAAMSVPHRSALEKAILKAMRDKQGAPDGPR